MLPRKYLLLAALAVVALSCVLVWLFMDRQAQQKKLREMQTTIETLQASLKEKEDELKKAPSHSRVNKNAQSHPAGNHDAPETPGPAAGSYQVLQELEDDSATDARS